MYTSSLGEEDLFLDVLSAVNDFQVPTDIGSLYSIFSNSEGVGQIEIIRIGIGTTHPKEEHPYKDVHEDVGKRLDLELVYPETKENNSP